jgi:hypothetical protein
MTAQWSILYSDGSANRYRFHAADDDRDAATFVYEPVTPERSSTGTYSGGPPRAGRVAGEELATLWRRVRAFEEAAHLQVADRGKGTGAFSVTDGDGTRTFIIARGDELAAFDAFVAALA